MLIAAVVTSIELAMHAWLPELHRVLGLFLPLIVTNCALLGRAEAFASRTDPARAALDGFAVGLGFLGVLLALGALREFVGQAACSAAPALCSACPGWSFTWLAPGDCCWRCCRRVRSSRWPC
jgi:Na+-translocating ferredoxin:NAD+ oxidoreductase subunit E